MSDNSFPIGSSVLLQNLKSDQYNDKKGIVRSKLDPMSGRQEVYIFDLEKSMAIKPVNIKYEPRDVGSLSISEMKSVLILSNKKEEELKGLDKDDLQKMVAYVAGSPEEIAALVAKANEPKSTPATTTSNNGSFTSEQLKQATDRMSSMNPDQLRQQAATMKAMGPAALRNMNPQMAHMTDDQINMAINQMEAMANNPAMMKAATEQMKGMNEEDLRQAMGQSAAAPPAPRPVSTSNTTMNDTIKNMSSDQLKEASQKISSLSPEQLKQQAAMLKSMPIETLRKTNPHMANMSEDQIKLAIQQMETMSENPEMMKMVSEQMKNMDDQQFEQVKQMFQNGNGAAGVGTGAGAASSSANGSNNLADLTADPSKMMESLLSNPEQLSSMIKTMKQNPDLMKSMMKSQMGIKDGDANNDPKIKQMEQAIDQFANMSDEQLDKYIRYANKAQSVFAPVLSGFNKAKSTLGVSSRTMIMIINLLVFGGIALLVMWIRSRGQIVEDMDVLNELQNDDEPSEMDAGHDESEF